MELTYLVSDFSEFVLNIIIEFQQNPLLTVYGKISCAVSSIITAGYAAMIAVIIYVLNRKAKNTKSVRRTRAWQSRSGSNESIQVKPNDFSDSEAPLPESALQPLGASNSKWVDVPQNMDMLTKDFRQKNIYFHKEFHLNHAS